MVDTLSGGAANTGPTHPSAAEPPAETDVAIISENIGEMRQIDAAKPEEQGYFFRGLVIFLGIAIVFWILVIALLRFL
jgi:hypothetical protein